MKPLGVYLMRHSDAERYATGGDSNRSLSAHGRRVARKVGTLLAEQDGHIDHIFTSPLVRAVQTTEIVAGCLGLDSSIAARLEVAAPSRIEDITALLDEVDTSAQGVAIVGHEPTMSSLLLHMLGGHGSDRWMGFSPAQVVALSYDRGDCKFAFSWMIAPDGPSIVPTLAG